MDLSEVFSSEGVPIHTFVKPINFDEILFDVKKQGTPVVIEGYSGTGKTTTIKKILEILQEKINITYLSAMDRNNTAEINLLTNEPKAGYYVIDDFHRLTDFLKIRLANLAKLAADTGNTALYPKFIFIGINKANENLVSLVSDIGIRCPTHKIETAKYKQVVEIIKSGEALLNVKFPSYKQIYDESKGDFWLTQAICQTICLLNKVQEKSSIRIKLKVNLLEVRASIFRRYEALYISTVKKFSRGINYRTNNKKYFTFLEYLSTIIEFPVELSYPRQTAEPRFLLAIEQINNSSLKKLIESDTLLNSNFYYDVKNNLFNIENPKLHYYLKCVNWNKLRSDFGFSQINSVFKYDIAISYAHENIDLARDIANSLLNHDFSVYFDEFEESKCLGIDLDDKFIQVFKFEASIVLPMLDLNYKKKMWTRYESEVFQHRIQDNSVIPIFLDETIFLGINQSRLGIDFKGTSYDKSNPQLINEIITKLIQRMT